MSAQRLRAIDPDRIATFTLIQWKHAIALEAKINHGGRRMFRRSVRCHAARLLGLPDRAPAEAVVAKIQSMLDHRQHVNIHVGPKVIAL